MPSVVGLLEQHELVARRRIDDLHEEAYRTQAELAAAEEEWQEWVIARRRVEEVASSVLSVYYQRSARASARKTATPEPPDAR